MARANSRADNRIGALNSERVAVDCEPVCENVTEDKMRDRGAALQEEQERQDTF
jgi:hypothetical protein